MVQQVPEMMCSNPHMKKAAADPVRLSPFRHRMSLSNLKMILMTDMIRVDIHHGIRIMVGIVLHRTLVVNSPIRTDFYHHHITHRIVNHLVDLPAHPNHRPSHQVVAALQAVM